MGLRGPFSGCGATRNLRSLPLIRHADYVYAARRAGVDLAFFGANTVYWRILLTSSPSGPKQRMQRNGLFRNTARREQDLTGVHYVVCCSAAGNTDCIVQPVVLAHRSIVGIAALVPPLVQHR
ncbi:MAG: hypothetical protein CL908_00810 [Deltaproteobacteria bacterium]|nr:hypothetical protein [Deltaproteobacteria bacterium]